MQPKLEQSVNLFKQREVKERMRTWECKKRGPRVKRTKCFANYLCKIATQFIYIKNKNKTREKQTKKCKKIPLTGTLLYREKTWTFSLPAPYQYLPLSSFL